MPGVKQLRNRLLKQRLISKRVELEQTFATIEFNVDPKIKEQIEQKVALINLFAELIKIVEFTAHDPPTTKKKITKLLTKWELEHIEFEQMQPLIALIQSESGARIIELAAEYYTIDQILDNPQLKNKSSSWPLYGLDVKLEGDKNSLIVDLMSGLLPLQGIKALAAGQRYVFVDLGYFMTRVLQFTRHYLSLEDRMEVVQEDVLTYDLKKESVSRPWWAFPVSPCGIWDRRSG